MIFWPFPGWPQIGHFDVFMGFWGFGRVCIEFTAPLTFILTKFQPEKCYMGPVPIIFHDFHESGRYPVCIRDFLKQAFAVPTSPATPARSLSHPQALPSFANLHLAQVK